MKETINQFLNEIQTINELYNLVADTTGENFNLFSILEIETDEVKTHSRFLAELLNPKGAHGQSDSFLKLFIKKLQNTNLNTKYTDVYTEYCIDNGRIDIFLKDNEDNIIIIENKIYAKEREDQLFDYYKTFPNSKLVFLNLFGEDSNEDSSNNIDYETISYEKDIIDWLEKCKAIVVDIPIIRESLTTYINLIKKLTNQNLNEMMNEKISKRILKDRSSFNAYKTLVQTSANIKSIIITENFLPFLHEIVEKHNLKLIIDEEHFLEPSNKWTGFFIETKALLNNNLQIFFEFEGKDHKMLSFGLNYKNLENKDSFSYENIRNRFQNEFGIDYSDDSSLCSKGYSKYSNWADLNTLEEIKFGSFKKDFENKIMKIINML
jgi:hypothetical protein